MYVPLIVYRNDNVFSRHTSLLGTIGSDNAMTSRTKASSGIASSDLANRGMSTNATMHVAEYAEFTALCGSGDDMNPCCFGDPWCTHHIDQEVLGIAAAESEYVIKQHFKRTNEC